MTPSRTALRRRLALTTALAGSAMLLAAAPARAQQLPQAGTVIYPSGGTVDVTITTSPTTTTTGTTGGPILPPPGSTALDIGLKAPATVINWAAFNVVGTSAAAPATVNFSQGAGAGSGAVVINRVIGFTDSTISNGSVTTYGTLGDAATKQNTTLYLLNPNGILIGGTGAIDAGVFMGSTLDICTTITCSDATGTANLTALGNNTALNLTAAAASTTAVTVGGAIKSGGALVVTGGQVIVQPGATLTASGEVQLIAATDVMVSSPGSPLVYAIKTGSQVAGTLVSSSGAITGASVVIAAVRPDAATGALLNLAGTITATGVGMGARGVVLLGGTGSSDPMTAVPGDPTPASVNFLTVGAGNGGTGTIGSTATLTASGQNMAGEVIVNGTGGVTIGGPVAAGGAYRVTGTSVTLGQAQTAIGQRATLGSSIRASATDIVGLGTLSFDSVTLTAAQNARLNAVSSATGDVTVVALGGDVTGLDDGTGVFGAATLTAASASVATGMMPAIADGNVAVFAGRTAANVATGGTGLAQLGTVTAGNNVSVFAQRIDAATVQAGAVSATPPAAGAASGTATLHAYAGDVSTTQVALRVGSVSAGTGSAARPAQDVLLTADAANATVMATTLSADRDVTVVAGSGTNGTAAITGEVRAGQLVPMTGTAGAYSVTAGLVTLGAAGATVQQSAAGAVTIRSTATDIVGSGMLTLQSNSDGPAAEALTLNATRAIQFSPGSILLGGTAASRSDILVQEGTAATVTSFGKIRGQSFRSISALTDALLLYGNTTFADTLDVQQPLSIDARNGNLLFQNSVNVSAGGASIRVTTAGNSLAANANVTARDAIMLYAQQNVATPAVVTSTAGRVQIDAVGGNATGDRVKASRGDVSVTAGTLASYNTLSASDFVSVGAPTINVGGSDAGTYITMTATAADDVTTGAESLVLGTGTSGSYTTLTNTGGSIRVGGVDAALAGAGAITLDAYGNARIGGAAMPAFDGLFSRMGDVAVTAHHGDITGAPTGMTFGRANLRAEYGNVTVTADAQAIGAGTAGLVQLGAVFAQTKDMLTGAATAPAASGNIAITGRVIDVTSVDTARFEGGATVSGGGGSLMLTAREGTPGNDVHLVLGTATIGTTADIAVGTGTAAGPAAANGTAIITSLISGNDLLPGGATAVAGNALITTAGSARLGQVTSNSGSVAVTATNGDVTGLANATGFDRVNLAAASATLAQGANRETVDGGITVLAGPNANGMTTATPAAGAVLLGTAIAGGSVTVRAESIDVTTARAGVLASTRLPMALATAAAGANADVAMTAHTGDLIVDTASAGDDNSTVMQRARDVLLTAVAGKVNARTLVADRNVTVSAGDTVTVRGLVNAGGRLLPAPMFVGRDTTGAFTVTGRSVTLGAAGSMVEQQAAGAVSITSTQGDIAGLDALTLRSNALGLADADGSTGYGTRSLTLDAAGSIQLALPEGLTVPQRDAVSARLIGGTDNGYESVVRVRAGAGAEMRLGKSIDARSLRSVDTTAPAFAGTTSAANAGTMPLFHSGDIRVGSVTTAKSLGIVTYVGSPTGGNRLLQIDNATSINGNVELVASGDIRGYALAPGLFVATNLTATSGVAASSSVLPQAGRVDTYSATGLFNSVLALNAIGLTTFGGTLRVATAMTRSAGVYTTPAGFDKRAILLDAAGDLRLGSAFATSGDIAAIAEGGDVTGLAFPGNGLPVIRYDPISFVRTLDGNISVQALGTAATNGLVDISTLEALTTEAAGNNLPVRGNVGVTGQRIALGTVNTANTVAPGNGIGGALTITARQGGTTAANEISLVLGTATVGTTATISVGAGAGTALSGTGMPPAPLTPNGTATITSLTSGTNLVSGGTSAIAGDAVITTAGSARLGQVTSQTGGVTVTAMDGDVTGLADVAGAFGRVNLTAARATVAQGANKIIADGGVAAYAGRNAVGMSTTAAASVNGLAQLGTVTAGGAVTVGAQRIDVTTARSGLLSSPSTATATAGANADVVMTAYAGDLVVDTASAGDDNSTVMQRARDVLLTSVNGNVTARGLVADRNVRANAKGVATVSGGVSAGGRFLPGNMFVGRDTTGSYGVTGSSVLLGTTGSVIEQRAAGAVSITSTQGGITGIDALTLRSNALGLADADGSTGYGTRSLTLDAAGTVQFALPDASPSIATVMQRDAVSARLIGGSDAAPLSSVVRVRAGAGAEMRLGASVDARSLRSVSGTPVPTFAGTTSATNAGITPLFHSGDILVGRVTTAESLGIVTYVGTPTGGNRLLQIDNATSGGNIQLVASGAIRGWTLAPNFFVSTNLTATNGVAASSGVLPQFGRVDTYSATGLFNSVLALNEIGLTTFGSTLRVATAMTQSTGVYTTPAGFEKRAILVDAAGDVRIGSAIANSGDISAIARTGDVTGLPTPDNGSANPAYLPVSLIRAAEGNVSVQALGTADTKGLVNITSVEARSTEPAGTNAPVRGNVDVTGQRVALGSVTTANLAAPGTGIGGALTITARQGGTMAVKEVSLVLGTATVGTTATINVGQGAGAALTGTGTPPAAANPNGTATIASLTAGTNLVSGGTTAIAGNATITSAGTTLIGQVTSNTGNVVVTAVNGDVTGLASGPNANLTAAAATAAQGTSKAIANGTITVLAGRAADDTITATGTNGRAQLANLGAGGSVRVSAVPVAIVSGAVVAGGRLTAGSPLPVPTITAGADPAATYSVTGASVTLGTTGAAVAQIAAAGVTIISGAGGVTGLGTLTLRSNADGAGSELLRITATGGDVTFGTPSIIAGGTDANGSNVVIAATPGATSGGLVTLGTVTAGTLTSGKTIVVRGRDLTLQGPPTGSVVATTVQLFNQTAAANPTLLGDGLTGTGFAVGKAEFDRIAAQTLTIGSGADDTATGELAIAAGTTGARQDTSIGTLALLDATGANTVQVLGTGTNTIAVSGPLSAAGAATRVVQLGGAAGSTTGEVARINIVNNTSATGTSAATGSINVGSGIIDLRGTSILAGQQSFIDAVRASSNVGSDYIANPNSSLYGVNGYRTNIPVALVQAGQLKLRFSGYALFQNTGLPGVNSSGVVLTGQPSGASEAQPLVLRSDGMAQASGFSLFGTINGFKESSAALLGSNYISNGATGNNGVNPSAARVNGCLIGSASGGCLVASIAQPSLNVFDVSREQVLRGSDQLVVTFDPLVGSNNEALFGDVAAGDYQFDAVTCPDGTVAAECRAPGGHN